MTDTAARLERVIAIVLRAGMTTSSICLAAGLVLAFAGPAAGADLLLHGGIIILLATPVARVLISIVEYVRQRDWRFAALTALVLMELMASAAAALVFNRRV